MNIYRSRSRIIKNFEELNINDEEIDKTAKELEESKALYEKLTQKNN